MKDLVYGWFKVNHLLVVAGAISWLAYVTAGVSAAMGCMAGFFVCHQMYQFKRQISEKGT